MKKKTKVKKEVVKKPKKVKAPKLQASDKEASFESQVKAVLSHILELFKSSLIDAFRQYICSRGLASQPASVEDFMEIHKHTVSAHNISKETLLDGLSEFELECMTNNQGKVAVGNIQVDKAQLSKAVEAAGATPAPAKKDTSVFDSLDMIEL